MDTESLYKFNTMITELSDRVNNVEGWLKSIDTTISNYIFSNPKRDDDFVEQRLIALEAMTKTLSHNVQFLFSCLPAIHQATLTPVKEKEDGSPATT